MNLELLIFHSHIRWSGRYFKPQVIKVNGCKSLLPHHASSSFKTTAAKKIWKKETKKILFQKHNHAFTWIYQVGHFKNSENKYSYMCRLMFGFWPAVFASFTVKSRLLAFLNAIQWGSKCCKSIVSVRNGDELFHGWLLSQYKKYSVM